MGGQRHAPAALPAAKTRYPVCRRPDINKCTGQYKTGRDSSVGIATRYGLPVRGSNPGGEARLSAPVQTGPGAHPASSIMGTGSFPGVKRPGRGADHPPSSSAEVKQTVELYFFCSSGPSWPVVR